MPIPVTTYFEPQGSGYIVDNTYVKGSVRSVLDDTERLNIPIQNRSIGMVVHEQTSDFSYRLGGGVSNSDWILLPVVAAFVDEVAGTGVDQTHNLGKYPAVTIIDTSGNLVFGRIIYNSIQDLSVYFSEFVRGEIYLA